MHFTYSEEADLVCLSQGDVIRKSDELQSVLAEYFPYYEAHDDYPYFIVLTQSCDLVRRDGAQCKAPYITISPVRPFERAVEREVEKLRYDDLEKKFSFADNTRLNKLNDFVERLLNNNEQDYFFLYREPDVGFDRDCCAFLKLSIALKAEHYDTLLRAKVLQLEESFQHKLGYNVGSSYARIGTKDWVPTVHDDVREFKRFVKTIYKPKDFGVWVEKPIHKEVLKLAKEVPEDQLDDDKFLELMKKAKDKNKSNKQDASRIITEVIESKGVEAQRAELIAKILMSRPDFASLIK